MYIGEQKQLFVDDFMIERLDGVEQVMHRAVKDLNNPILSPENPEEDLFLVGFGTVLYDEDDDVFKMWYQRWDGLWDCTECDLRYAISDDGLRWAQPDLGLVEYEGTRHNNIVLRGPAARRVVDSVSVVKDGHDPDPDRRYKLLAWSADERGKEGICVFFSPDGIRWTACPANPVICYDHTARNIGDTHHAIGWDEARGCYVGLLRPGGLPRRIGRSESPDFIHWPLPQQVIAPDDRDASATQFYCMPTLLYENVYIGMLYILANSGAALPGATDNAGADTMEIQLATSRDTIHWDRRFRETFIPVGPAGSFDSGMIFAARPLVTADEIRIYYGGFNVLHSEHQPNERAAIGLARVRLDGFVSVDGGPIGGSLTTNVFEFQGRRLEVNADASHGQLEVEVLDRASQPVSGFGRAECVALRGDSLRHEVHWRDERPLAALQGQPIRLRFHLKNASLYAFQFKTA